MVLARHGAAILAVVVTAVLVIVAAAPAGGQKRARSGMVTSEGIAFDVRGKAAATVTGTRRVVGRRRGFLTRPSKASPQMVALSFVRKRPDAFGLDAGDLGGLRQVRRYRSRSGITHLQWEQTYRGIPVFGTEVRANVDDEGRLINAGGAPLPDPSVPSTDPALTEREAVRAAGGEEGSGELVLFPDVDSVRLAWRVRAEEDSQHVWDAVVDAGSGKLLYRRNLVLSVQGRAFDNYPGAPRGGGQLVREFPNAWFSDVTRLRGKNAHVYADANDNDVAGASEEIPRTGSGTYNYTPTFQGATRSGQNCPPVGCSFNHFAEDGDSDELDTTVNRRQAGAQLFYYVNRFRDHLAGAPGIGFTAASGGFEGDDPLIAEVQNGGSTAAPPFTDLPVCQYLNNANMATGPDGTSPRMQIFLWSNRCTGGTTNGVDGANDALIVYHEYTHGVSNRLITDASGNGALNGAQSSAMGEGWSDWYAVDLLVAQGFEVDTPNPGELRTGRYEAQAIRRQGFDCPVDSGPPACPGTQFTGPGGFTYGDFSAVGTGGAEEHDDGEIWVETLWDLRQALTAAHGNAEGVVRARSYITDGMRLSPAGPTFLDARNAILQADANRGLRDRDLIWAVFANRGMGLNARTTGDNDIFPVPDFTRPPPLDRLSPTVSRFSVSRKRFRLGRTRTPRTALTRRGTSFRFRLSERADVKIVIHRGLPGRRVGKSCKRATRKLRERRRCTRYIRRGTLTRRRMRAGSRRVAFTGRIGSTKLKVGSYRATISATDAAKNRSTSRRASFKVVRR